MGGSHEINFYLEISAHLVQALTKLYKTQDALGNVWFWEWMKGLALWGWPSRVELCLCLREVILER